MKHIKALSFDVDNTLYTHRIHDSPTTTRQTLNRLKENGYRTDIATGRCRYKVRNLPVFLRDFVFDAAVFDRRASIVGREETVISFPLLQEQVERLIRYREQRHIPMWYSIFDNDYLITPCSHNIHDEFFKLYLNIPVVEPYKQETAFDVLAYPQNGERRKETIAPMKDTLIVTRFFNTLEITVENVDESKGAKVVTARWDISVEQIVCFGDGANDVGMLQAAGIGIAMGNANLKIKAAADYVYGSIDEDGLYHFRKEME